VVTASSPAGRPPAGTLVLDRVPRVDRNRARANIRAGLLTACIALFVFGLTFYVTILYIA
jgi:hypothetical protein